MFSFKALIPAKPPTGLRSFSTSKPGPAVISGGFSGLSLNLHDIGNSRKRFSNPNFVNRFSPNMLAEKADEVDPDCCPRKTRLNSDCASEDSFIVFDCESGSDLETESDETDSDTSDVDEVDFVRMVPFKKVRFSEEPCVVHRMIKWDYAYRAARKGHWEELARDRCRFGGRIAKAADVIGPVLGASHRRRIFDERFREVEDTARSVSVIFQDSVRS